MGFNYGYEKKKFDSTISRNRLWSYFSHQKEKALPRNNVR